MRFLLILMVWMVFSTPAHAANVVVLELFTSQLCGYSADGDAVFQDILEQDHDVIGLSCHVQGYNIPGGEQDTLSREFCDDRHMRYVQALSADVVAVPMMVANGRYDMSGVRRSLVEAGVALARVEGGVAEVGVRVAGAYLEIDLAAQDVAETSDVWLFAYDDAWRAGGRVYMNAAQHLVKVMSWDGAAKGISFPLRDIRADGYAVVVQNTVDGVIAAGRF